MPAPHPLEVREAAVAAYLRQEGTREEVAARFGLSLPSLTRYLALHRKGLLAPRKSPGPTPILNAADREVLGELARSDRQATREQLAQQLAQRTGKHVSVETLQRTLRWLGIRRVRAAGSPKRAPRTVRSAPAKPATPEPDPLPQPTRYTAAHRPDPRKGYPSDLTDAEWAVVEPHFAPRTRDFDYPPRLTLNAIFYVLRSGCAWRMMPHDFPPWDTVYSAFRRWSRDGRLAFAHEALRRQFRRHIGRQEQPTAAIIDSQSVKTTEKGDPKGTMAARR